MENTLKVGDKVYAIKYREISEVFTIDRVTKVSAFSESNRFKIEYQNGYINGIPLNTYGPAYYIETPELKHKLKMQKIKSKVSKMNIDKLSEEQLIQIANIIDTKDN